MSGLSHTVTENYPTDTFFVVVLWSSCHCAVQGVGCEGAICTERMHSLRLMRNSRPQGVRDRK